MELYYVSTLLLVVLPLVGWLILWWNEIWFVARIKAKISSSSSKTKMPPGYLGFPLLGETLTFMWYFNIIRRPDDFINHKRHKYGDNIGAYRTHLFGSPSIIACSPALCKFVLHSSEAFKQEWPTAEALGPNSVITLDHDAPHHHLIKNFIMSFINRPDSLARITLQVQPSVIAALQSWSQMGQIKAFDELKKVILDYMGRYIAHFESSSQSDAFVNLFNGITEGIRAHAWNIPGTAYHHAVKCRKKLIKILREDLEKRKQNAKDKTRDDDGDLMDLLMQVKDKEGNYLRDEEVLDNVLSSIHVSHASAAYVVAWSLYFLAKSPHVLQKLREENMAISREKRNGYITYEDISNLKYTNKVVEETLRMTNISGFVFRTATHDIKFKDYLIPKGWKVIVWLRYLHTNPDNFENPMCFNPDRWDTRPRHGTYLPFGGGVRSCPGSMFVRVNVAIFLHHLSVGYKWKLLNPNTPIQYLSHPHPNDGFEISINKV